MGIFGSLFNWLADQGEKDDDIKRAQKAKEMRDDLVAGYRFWGSPDPEGEADRDLKRGGKSGIEELFSMPGEDDPEDDGRGDYPGKGWFGF